MWKHAKISCSCYHLVDDKCLKMGKHGNINLSNFCNFDARNFATSAYFWMDCQDNDIHLVTWIGMIKIVEIAKVFHLSPSFH